MMMPIGDRVLVKDVMATDPSVIAGVEHAIRSARIGIVIRSSKRAAVSEGERVVYDHCAGEDTVIDDKDFVLLHARDLLAVVD